MLCPKCGNTSRSGERVKRRGLQAQITRPTTKGNKAAGKTSLDPSSSRPSLAWRLIFSASGSRLTSKRSLDWLKSTGEKGQLPDYWTTAHVRQHSKTPSARPVPQNATLFSFLKTPNDLPNCQVDNLLFTSTSITGSPKGSPLLNPSAWPDNSTIRPTKSGVFASTSQRIDAEPLADPPHAQDLRSLIGQLSVGMTSTHPPRSRSVTPVGQFKTLVQLERATGGFAIKKFFNLGLLQQWCCLQRITTSSKLLRVESASQLKSGSTRTIKALTWVALQKVEWFE